MTDDARKMLALAECLEGYAALIASGNEQCHLGEREAMEAAKIVRTAAERLTANQLATPAGEPENKLLT